MPLQLGDQAPDFEAETTEGTIRFHDWAGDAWVMFFSHSKDFTPVCTTELGEVARLWPEFARRNVKPIGLSVDAISDHTRWARDIQETQGTPLNFPLIADPERRVASLYGMIHPKSLDTSTVRTVFIIDPARRIRLTLTYPASTGRNFDELLRVIDSLQLTASHAVATPANRNAGNDVIIAPSPSNDDLNWVQAISEWAADAVIFADRDGAIRIWNRGAETIFGYSAGEVLNGGLDVIIPERFRSAHWEGYRRAIETGHTRNGPRVLTTRSVHKDGSTLYVDLSFGVVRSRAGAVAGALAIGRDCTARYLADRALRARVQQLEHALTSDSGTRTAGGIVGTSAS